MYGQHGLVGVKLLIVVRVRTLEQEQGHVWLTQVWQECILGNPIVMEHVLWTQSSQRGKEY